MNKGKPKKVALIAVSNKLLKIALAVAKSEMPYDENFRSKNVGLDLKKAKIYLVFSIVLCYASFYTLLAISTSHCIPKYYHFLNAKT